MKKCLIILTLLLCSCSGEKYEKINYDSADKSYWDVVYNYIPSDYSYSHKQLCNADFMEAEEKKGNDRNVRSAYKLVSIEKTEDTDEYIKFTTTLSIDYAWGQYEVKKGVDVITSYGVSHNERIEVLSVNKSTMILSYEGATSYKITGVESKTC